MANPNWQDEVRDDHGRWTSGGGGGDKSGSGRSGRGGSGARHATVAHGGKQSVNTHDASGRAHKDHPFDFQKALAGAISGIGNKFEQMKQDAESGDGLGAIGVKKGRRR